MVIPESGVRTKEVHFTRNSEGTVQQDPSWLRYSDNVRSFDWAPDSSVEAQRGLGHHDPKGFFEGSETHEVTVVYDLQKQIADGKDAAYDFTQRDADSQLPNGHTIREKNVVENGGVEDAGFKIFTLGRRAKADVTIPGDATTGQPLQLELAYQAEKVRSHLIHQPSGEATLAAKSTDANDTTQSLTIESNEATVTEDLALNGTTTVNTTSVFANIDALELDSETKGNVVLTNFESGATLAQIYGSDEYDGMEGDLGVPGIDSGGSYEGEIGQEYERFLSHDIERPDGEDLAYNVSNVELTIDNGLETTERSGKKTMRVEESSRTTEVTATLHGEKASHEQIMEYLKGTPNDIKWKMTHSTLTADAAVLTDAGSRTREAEQAIYQFDNTFASEGLKI